MFRQNTVLICTLIILQIMTGCTKKAEAIIPTMDSKFLGVTAEYHVNWDDKTGDVTDKFFLDEQIALEIANSILKKLKGVEYINTTDYLVYELESQEVIVVSRMNKDKMTDGGNYNVALDKNNGKILKIWTEE